MIFATQTPKEIDNKIVSNCTTHVYGRMNAPAMIDAIRELMVAKGRTAEYSASYHGASSIFRLTARSDHSKCTRPCA
jgi:hypothetical protein